MRSDDLYALPAGLPVPVDDGACDHLRGMVVAPISLASTRGRRVRLDEIATRWTVVYAYPRTGVPDVDSPDGWDAIPGARGCTPQSCSYRDHIAELHAAGATVFGLSTQSTEYQQEMAARLHLPFEVLSDADLALTRAMRLPTFQYGEWTVLKRHTLVVSKGRIEEVFYPVFPPDADAEIVLHWLQERNAP
jgi:peroxiredoxin